MDYEYIVIYDLQFYFVFIFEQWYECLSDEEYYVLCEVGIEVFFVGEYIDIIIEGVYCCCVCGVELFCFIQKFYFSCGWLFFYVLLVEDWVWYFNDEFFFGCLCIEVRCVQCDFYFGYVFVGEGFDIFIDLRYCINFICLDLVLIDEIM